MWGFTIYLMGLADYLTGRKHRKSTCDICKKGFDTIEQMETHRRNEHPEKLP